MSMDWELETAALAVAYRAMEVALYDTDGRLTGQTMPVIPVEYTEHRLVVAIPHCYATWLPPILFTLGDGDGEPSADGSVVTGSFIVLGTEAADSLVPSTGEGWVVDGRWPTASSVLDHLTNVPEAITSRQIVMAGPRWHDGGLPPTPYTVGPQELDYSFQNGLSLGDWSGLLSMEWPIPEPLQEPPHDATDVDAPFLDAAEDGGVPLADQESPAIVSKSGKGGRSVSKNGNKVPPAVPAKKATTTQRLDSMHDDMSQLTQQVAQISSMLAAMQVQPRPPPAPVPSSPPPRPSSKGAGFPGYNPFQTSMVGQPYGGGPAPISGTPVWQAADSSMRAPPPHNPYAAGMMGPPLAGRMAQSGTSILAPKDGGISPESDLRAMVASVLAEVGVAPKSVPGKASSVRPGEILDREQIRQMVSSMMQESSGGPNLLSDGADTDVSGARGAVAYAREKTKFENNPLTAYNDFRVKARRLLGRGGSQPTTFKHLMSELPFGTMNNRKRMALLLLTMLDEMEAGNQAMVQGLMVQAMRWIILDLENPRDPLTSWRLTFQPDPIPMQCPVRSAGGLDLNSSLLDPAQLTSTLGMSRDMELLSKRLKGQKEEEPAPRVPKSKKGDNKGGGKGDP